MSKLVTKMGVHVPLIGPEPIHGSDLAPTKGIIIPSVPNVHNRYVHNETAITILFE